MLRSIINYFLPRKSLNGYMLTSKLNNETGAREQHRYSPYFEHELAALNGDILIRVVSTYGFERIPNEDIFNKTSNKKLREWNRDGLTPCVTEIYIFNYSENTVIFNEIKLNIDDEIMEVDEAISITPHNHYLSNPLISLKFNMATELPVSLQISHEGSVIRSSGITARKTTDEINLKYSQST